VNVSSSCPDFQDKFRAALGQVAVHDSQFKIADLRVTIENVSDAMDKTFASSSSCDCNGDSFTLWEAYSPPLPPFEPYFAIDASPQNGKPYPLRISDFIKASSLPLWGCGRLEVRAYGEWGTVCDDHFRNDEAAVACRQLGCDDGAGASYISNFGGYLYQQQGLPMGEGRVWMDDVECSGSETSLYLCARRPWGQHNCGSSHYSDVGICCRGFWGGGWQ